MQLRLIADDGTTVTGETALANPGTLTGAVYEHAGILFVVVSRPRDGTEILTALEATPMVLGDSNFTVS